MKTIMKITAGILLASVVLIGGCAALVGSAANEVDKEMQQEHDASAITKAQLDSVQMGDKLSEVKATLGEPEDSQEMESEGILDDETYRSDCIYYNVKGRDWSDISMYQLCFDNHRLSSKNRF